VLLELLLDDEELLLDEDDELLLDDVLLVEGVVLSFLQELANGAIKATPRAAIPPFKKSLRSIIFYLF
jgi:hypothetical protein